MRRALSAFAIGFIGLLWLTPVGQADESFGLKGLSVEFLDAGDNAARLAGSHPFRMRTQIFVNSKITSEEGELPVNEVPIDAVRTLITELPPGMAGDPYAATRCSGADFVDVVKQISSCPDSAAIGLATVRVGVENPIEFTTPVYNLIPAPGSAAKLGLIALGDVPVTLDIGVNPDPPYNVIVRATNIAQPIRFYGADLEIWGTPASSAHDKKRGSCIPKGGCSANIPIRPFITLPRSCSGTLKTLITVDSWQNPGAFLEYRPQTPGMVDCEVLKFAPELNAQTTTDHAESPTGMDVTLTVKDENLPAPDGIAHSDIKKAVVALPEGVTANPSLAEGLETCSEDQLDLETAFSEPGKGCPEASKVGTVEVKTPILREDTLYGDLFVATQNENPFNSLLALYLVIKDPKLGVLVKVPGRIDPDPRTGQLVTTFGEAPYELPQFPLGNVRFHLREGGRSPLISPPSCDANPATPGNDPYVTKATFTPWANPSSPYTTTSTFKITRGPGGGGCPDPDNKPFEPGFSGGTLTNSAGSYSPFVMRLKRRDGDQDLTRFDVSLPSGVVAKLAGVTQCSDAAIAVAKAKTGREERRDPSCPQNSQVGTLWGGAGVGSQLTYVPGKLYLAGPIGGAPLSAVGVVPAVAGPFDVGTVVVRQALRIDSRTGDVRVDGAVSDPVPHMLAGIPLRVRDIQVRVDREQFTRNPTNCKPSLIQAAIWGGGLDPFSIADDSPTARSERFQAADCASLGFKPRLSLRLKGGTKRGDFPALRTTLTPRPQDANIERLVLRLPRSAFLEQGHFRTICTRVQFAAGGGNGERCPPGSIYGKVRAWSPIIDAPAEGSVYLRSSSRDLPDLVLALQGPPSAAAKLEITARVDSHKGGIRVTTDKLPDLPVEKALVTMQGGQKGLIVNSRNLCAGKSKANAEFSAQNGKQITIKPLVKPANCKKGKRRKAR